MLLLSLSSMLALSLFLSHRYDEIPWNCSLFFSTVAVAFFFLFIFKLRKNAFSVSHPTIENKSNLNAQIITALHMIQIGFYFYFFWLSVERDSVAFTIKLIINCVLLLWTEIQIEKKQKTKTIHNAFLFLFCLQERKKKLCHLWRSKPHP